MTGPLKGVTIHKPVIGALYLLFCYYNLRYVILQRWANIRSYDLTLHKGGKRV